MTFTLFPDARLALARDSLAGLSVGDALGAQFFVPGRHPGDLAAGRLPPPPWPWTDDTEMACSVLAALADAGRSTGTGWRSPSPSAASPTAATGRAR